MPLKTNGYETVTVGMTVEYRQRFGRGACSQAVIETIELCENEYEKDGVAVTSVSAGDLHRCCLCLDDGHWCYGYQIDEILGVKEKTEDED